MELKKILISPLLAKEFLGNNPSNRRVNTRRVEILAKDMVEGKWKEDTAEFIKITSDGELIDGQHRLHAIVRANLVSGIPMWVAYGVSPSVFSVIDSGKPRSTSDIFSIKHIPNYSALSAGILLYRNLCKGLGPKGNARVPSHELIEMYYDCPEEWDRIITQSVNMNKEFSRVLPVSVIAGLYKLFGDKDKFEARNFWLQVTSGNTSFSALMLLRKRLISDRISINKMSPTIRIALIIKVWNYYRKNQAIKTLAFNTEREEYPKAI